MPVETSQAHGIGPLPLPPGNLTKPAVDSIAGDEAPASKTVGDYSAEQQAHVSRLQAIKYCVNPELYLNEAAYEYLPCDLHEEEEAYQIRLSRSYSTFRPFYTHLRNLIVGTALRRPIQMPEELPEEWEMLFRNVDLEGHSLQSFAKNLFSAAIDGGCCGLFIEYPEVDPGLNRAEEMRRGYRPYFVAIPSKDIIGWESEVSATTLGDETVYGRKLISLRIRDEVVEKSPTDEFATEALPAIRVYDFDGTDARVRHRLFVMRSEKNKAENSYSLDKTTYLSVNTIPFVPVYGGPVEAYMLARPLLLDVARLNLYHWSSSADLANQLHLTAVPKLVISGVKGGSGPGSDDFSMSPDKLLMLDNPDAKAQWLGAPMDGVEASMANLKNIEEAMEKLAAVAINQKQSSQPESGFSKLLDRAQSDSQLAVLVHSLEEALNIGIAMAAEYWKKPPIDISISRDFIPTKLHSQQILAYAELYKEKAYSHETFLRILEIGDVFDGIPDFDITEELARVEAERQKEMEEMAQQAQAESSINGRQVANNTVGRRIREGRETSSEVREDQRTSTPGG